LLAEAKELFKFTVESKWRQLSSTTRNKIHLTYIYPEFKSIPKLMVNMLQVQFLSFT